MAAAPEREVNQAGDECLAELVCLDPPNEADIELREIRPQLEDMAQARVAGPGVIDREFHSAERRDRCTAACLADDLPTLTVHLAYPLRLKKRLRSTNLLERSLEEVRRRTKVIGRFPGETSCLTMAWAVSVAVPIRSPEGAICRNHSGGDKPRVLSNWMAVVVPSVHS